MVVLVFLLYLFFTVACFSQPIEEPGLKDVSSKGEKLFKANCSGCHLNGQNLIKPGKPIIGSLKLKSKDSFKTFIESPPPPMPNFKNITSNPNQLDALYNYVISLKGK